MCANDIKEVAKLSEYVDGLEDELTEARKEIKQLRQRLDDIRDLTD